MASQQKQEIINEINSSYLNHNDFKGYLELALKKYKFENYGLRENQEIKPQDYIINDMNIRNIISNTLKAEQINKKTFNSILNQLTYEQMLYIGI